MILTMATVTAMLLLAGWLGRRRWPGLAGTVFGSTLLALPVLGFGQWPHWAVADRHAYLPHLVLIGSFVVALVRLRGSRLKETGTDFALLALVAGLAFLGGRQVLIWRNTDTLFRYVEQQPAFTWNPGQQAYIYQLWSAHAQEQGRTEDAREKNERARRTLVEGALQAAARSDWGEAIELSQLLEQSFGLPPLLRRERARWLLTLGRFPEAGKDLARTLQEMPEDPDTIKLINEWREGRGAGTNHL
jgi:hypothetical protein